MRTLLKRLTRGRFNRSQMNTNTPTRFARRPFLMPLLFAWPVLAVAGVVIGRWLDRPALAGILLAAWLLSLLVIIPSLTQNGE